MRKNYILKFDDISVLWGHAIDPKWAKRIHAGRCDAIWLPVGPYGPKESRCRNESSTSLAPSSIPLSLNPSFSLVLEPFFTLMQVEVIKWAMSRLPITNSRCKRFSSLTWHPWFGNDALTVWRTLRKSAIEIYILFNCRIIKHLDKCFLKYCLLIFLSSGSYTIIALFLIISVRKHLIPTHCTAHI